MKKLFILGLILSLFTFGGSKEEVKTTYAAEQGTSAMFYENSNQSSVADYYKPYELPGVIVNLKISNDANDLPAKEKRVCDPIMIPGCSKYDALGNEIKLEGEGVIFSYLSLASDSTSEKVRYDCVVYADVDIIYANPNANRMFWYFEDLETLDLGVLNTSKVENMELMFFCCKKLKSINFRNIDTSKVTNMQSMFDNCYALKELDLRKFDTSNVTNMTDMFCICESLENIYWDVEKFNTSKVTSMSNMFSSCCALKNLDVSHFNTENVTDMSGMFADCSSLTTLDVSNFDTVKVTNMSAMFAYLNVNELDVSNLNTSNVTDMTAMFCGLKVNELDVSKLDTKNVTNMAGMFSGLTVKNLDISNLNTSNVTNMSGMFSGLSVTDLDVSKLDTSKVTDMSMMFAGCEKLTSLNLSNFVTTNVTNMSGMFGDCKSLTDLNLSNFDTSKVTDISAMFAYCTSLKTLDISSFNLSNCDTYILVIKDEENNTTSTYDVFTGCTSLETIKTPSKMYADSDKNSEYALNLPEQFGTYCNTSSLTSGNIEGNEQLDIRINKFISEWSSLRDENNSICNALVPGSAANTKLNELLKQYETFDADTKTAVNGATDVEGVTIGESMTYINNVLKGTQSTEKDYGIAKEDSGSFMTLSIKEESPYLVAVISLIGVLSVAGYYFYNKKKQAM